jgi:putative DNA primase/helicase
MTAREWSDRVLGSNTITAGLPTRVLLAATGNNLAARADAARRWLRLTIDPGVERPELRQFAIKDLLAHVRQNRQSLLSDVFTILRAFIQAGKPNPDSITLGSFEEWASIVPAAIVWLGMENPLKSQEILAEDDPDTADLKALLTAWRARFQGQWLTVGDVTAVTARPAWNIAAAVFSKIDEDRSTRYLRDRLEGIGGPDLNKRRIGKYLSSHAGRICGGMRLEKTEDAALKVMRWRVASDDE